MLELAFPRKQFGKDHLGIIYTIPSVPPPTKQIKDWVSEWADDLS